MYVLCAILHAEDSIDVPQTTKLPPELTAYIVQPAIQKHLKLNLIEVADITIDRNNFSWRFNPVPSATDTIRKMFADEYMLFCRLVSKQTLLNAIMQIDKTLKRRKKKYLK